MGMPKTVSLITDTCLLSIVLRLGNAGFLINIISQILIQKEKKTCGFHAAFP